MTDSKDTDTQDTKPARGFAAMPADRRRMLARKGGVAVQRMGKGHQWTKETAAEAGRKSQASRKARRWTTEEARAAGRLGGRPRKNP